MNTIDSAPKPSARARGIRAPGYVRVEDCFLPSLSLSLGSFLPAAETAGDSFTLERTIMAALGDFLLHTHK